MTPLQIELARHALGLPNRAGESYRNHFVAGEYHTDHPDWMEMVAAGVAVRRAKVSIFGGVDCFHLTRAGAAAALRPGEQLDPYDDYPTAAPAAVSTPLPPKEVLPHDDLSGPVRVSLAQPCPGTGESSATADQGPAHRGAGEGLLDHHGDQNRVDPETGSDLRPGDGRVYDAVHDGGAEKALLSRPQGSNADEWLVFLTEHEPTYAAVQIAAAIERLTAEREGEKEARHKVEAALRGRDRGMEVLFDRLRRAGVDYSDLIP